jgi:protein TonB
MLILGAPLAPVPAQSGVEAGLNSIEMVITQETTLPKPTELPTEDVMALEATAPVELTLPHETSRETPQPKSAAVQPSVTVSDQGAQQEAKLDHLSNQAPRYPLMARLRGWEGVVVLRVLVNHDGAVGQIEVQQSSGHAVLDEAARQAVHGWRFSPARIGSIHLASWVTVPVRFQLIDGQG